LVTIKDIYESKKERHVNSYLKYLESKKAWFNKGFGKHFWIFWNIVC
jgi:hypothetical protein